jgi:hypothetical protein
LQPTLLGNRTAAVDDYALPRYKIDTSTLLMRLRGALPAGMDTALDTSQVVVQTHINCATSMAILALWECTRWDGAWHLLRQSIFFAIALAIAYLFYRAAIRAVGVVRENIISLVDVYRLRVIVAAGYAAPATVDEELEILKELRDFWTAASPRKAHRKLVVPQVTPEDKKEPDQSQDLVT